jgi:hypothetical protein
MRSETWTSGDWAALSFMDPATREEQARWNNERFLLGAFGDEANTAGLPLPEGTLDMLEPLKRDGGVSLQWIRDVRALAALAQHHGVPTRLLDFTTRAYVAAYFAALEPPNAAEDLCVWALDRSFLDHGSRSVGLWYDLLQAPRSSNPNLHAQSGVFVAWTSTGLTIHSLEDIVGDTIQGRIRLASGSLDIQRPVLRKLTLGRSHAKELLDGLMHEAVHGGSMFPGFDGVVRFIKEQVRRL